MSLRSGYSQTATTYKPLQSVSTPQFSLPSVQQSGAPKSDPGKFSFDFTDPVGSALGGIGGFVGGIGANIATTPAAQIIGGALSAAVAYSRGHRFPHDYLIRLGFDQYGLLQCGHRTGFSTRGIQDCPHR